MSDDFSARYRLLKCVLVEEGTRTHNAQELASGRVVMVHITDAAGPEEVDALRAQLAQLPAGDKNRVLETATLASGFAVVTEFLPAATSFRGWLNLHAPPAAPAVVAESIAPVAEPVAPAFDDGIAIPPASAQATGSFTQLFGVPAVPTVARASAPAVIDITLGSDAVESASNSLGRWGTVLAPTSGDPTPVGPTPADPVPVGPTPADPPVDPTPVDPQPTGPAPTPVDPMPGSPTPIQATAVTPTPMPRPVQAAPVPMPVPTPVLTPVPTPVPTPIATPAVLAPVPMPVANAVRGAEPGEFTRMFASGGGPGSPPSIPPIAAALPSILPIAVAPPSNSPVAVAGSPFNYVAASEVAPPAKPPAKAAGEFTLMFGAPATAAPLPEQSRPSPMREAPPPAFSPLTPEARLQSPPVEPLHRVMSGNPNYAAGINQAGQSPIAPNIVGANLFGGSGPVPVTPQLGAAAASPLFAKEKQLAGERSSTPGILPPPIFSSGSSTPLSSLGGATPQVNASAGPSEYTQLISHGRAPVIPALAPGNAQGTTIDKGNKRRLPTGLVVVINAVLLIAALLLFFVLRRPVPTMTQVLPQTPVMPNMPTAPKLNVPDKKP